MTRDRTCDVTRDRSAITGGVTGVTVPIDGHTPRSRVPVTGWRQQRFARSQDRLRPSTAWCRGPHGRGPSIVSRAVSGSLAAELDAARSDESAVSTGYDVMAATLVVDQCATSGGPGEMRPDRSQCGTCLGRRVVLPGGVARDHRRHRPAPIRRSGYRGRYHSRSARAIRLCGGRICGLLRVDCRVTASPPSGAFGHGMPNLVGGESVTSRQIVVPQRPDGRDSPGSLIVTRYRDKRAGSLAQTFVELPDIAGCFQEGVCGLDEVASQGTQLCDRPFATDGPTPSPEKQCVVAAFDWFGPHRVDGAIPLGHQVVSTLHMRADLAELAHVAWRLVWELFGPHPLCDQCAEAIPGRRPSLANDDRVGHVGAGQSDRERGEGVFQAGRFDRDPSDAFGDLLPAFRVAYLHRHLHIVAGES